MATFDAGLEELTFDFTKYVEGAKGTIPEPSSTQMEEFIALLREFMPTKQNADGEDVIDLDKVAEYFEGTDNPEDVINDAISAVCSGTPTAEQIGQLPYRVKQRFYGWMLGSLLAPEA